MISLLQNDQGGDMLQNFIISELVDSGIPSYHFKDANFYSLETAASKGYREMYQKVMENEEEWLFDFMRVRELQLQYLQGKNSYFVPDTQYSFMSAFQIKTGREVTHIRTKVNKAIIQFNQHY